MLIERGVDVGICRVRLRFEQDAGGEQHPGLAIAALRDVFLDPRALKRMTPVVRKPLDRRETLSRRVGCRDLAGTNRRVALKDRARTTNAHAAAVFGAGEPKLIAQYPKERSVALDVQRSPAAVYNYRYLGHRVSFATP
jgi:hypothetical protein